MGDQDKTVQLVYGALRDRYAFSSIINVGIILLRGAYEGVIVHAALVVPYQSLG
jgi:hypothetical protein